VDYWLGLPIIELLSWLADLAEQLESDHKAQEQAARQKR